MYINDIQTKGWFYYVNKKEQSQLKMLSDALAEQFHKLIEDDFQFKRVDRDYSELMLHDGSVMEVCSKGFSDRIYFAVRIYSSKDTITCYTGIDISLAYSAIKDNSKM